MTKAWLVARREYLYNLRRPAFLFAVFGAPLITILLLVVVIAITSSNQQDVESLGQIGYVDEAGVLSQAIEQPESFVIYEDEADARAALDAGTLGAYFVVPGNYLGQGRVQLYSQTNVPSALRRQIQGYLVANLGSRVSDEALFERIKSPVNLTVVLRDSGRELTESSALGLFIVPVVFAIVFLMATQTTSGYLMASVVEEKSTRMMEILVTSVTPLQLLVGKIGGLGALGLTQLVFWMLAGAVGLSLGQGAEFLQGVIIPLDLALLALAYFFLSYFLYAGIMAGIGASTSTEQESRQVAGIFGLVSALPFFFFTTLLTDPNSPILIVLTLIPFTSALTTILRVSLSAVPAWQIATSLLILFLSSVIVVWAAARVFRWAALLYGKRATPREIWRVIRGSARGQIGTVVATQGEQTG